MTDRVVLAYSGGLDTSVAIPYLAKMTGGEVVAVSLDLGQGGEDMESVRQRALDCGAVESIVVDAKDEFAEEYCLPTIKANGMYMKQYPLVSAISRPLIVKHLVQAAQEFGGTHVSHGCTGKGNNQVRFEVGFRSLAPELEIIAPARDYAWTRDKAIAFAEEINLPILISWMNGGRIYCTVPLTKTLPNPQKKMLTKANRITMRKSSMNMSMKITI